MKTLYFHTYDSLWWKRTMTKKVFYPFKISWLLIFKHSIINIPTLHWNYVLYHHLFEWENKIRIKFQNWKPNKFNNNSHLSIQINNANTIIASPIVKKFRHIFMKFLTSFNIIDVTYWKIWNTLKNLNY